MQKYLSNLLFSFSLIFIVSACQGEIGNHSWDGIGTYKPLGIPVVLSYDGEHLRIAASREIVTPIGTFGFTARISLTENQRDDEVWLIIRDRANNEQKVYAIERRDSMSVLLNGESVVTVGGDRRVTIDVLPDTEYTIDFETIPQPQSNSRTENDATSLSSRNNANNASRNSRFTAYVTATRLNIRSGPGPEYDNVGQLETDDRIIIIGRNNGGSWVQISNGNWLGARYLDIEGNIIELSVTADERGGWDSAGTVSGASLRAEEVLRIRGGPGEDYRQLNDPETLEPGDIVDIVGRSRDRAWYKINVSGKSGWVTADSRYSDLSGRTHNIPVVD